MAAVGRSPPRVDPHDPLVLAVGRIELLGEQVTSMIVKTSEVYEVHVPR